MTNNETTNAVVATVAEQPVQFWKASFPIESRRKAFHAWLASEPINNQLTNSLGVDDPTMVRRLCACVQKIVSVEPAKYLACTPTSWNKALSDAVSTGLIPDGKHAYLIPYGNELQYQLDYKGLVNLYYSHGCVKKIVANVFCENDEFGDTIETLYHSINWKLPRGNVIGAYAKAILNTGEEVHAVMTIEEIEAIRKRSKSGNSGPWKTDYNEMAKKTVFRNLSKWIPSTPQITQAWAVDDANNFDFDKPKEKEDVMSSALHAKMSSDIASLKKQLEAVKAAQAEEVEVVE